MNPIDIQAISPNLTAGAEQRAQALAQTDDAKQIERSAKGFEAVFLNKVFEEMQRSIPESGLLSSGITKQVQGMFWHYLAEDVADKGGIGMWKDIQQDMMRRYSNSIEPVDTQPKVELKS